MELCLSLIQEEYVNFKLIESRFYISQEEPFLEATPDTLIHGDCCGDGCLEIKCPFTGREKFIFELLGDDSFLLKENAITKLNVNDNYYYQIQCQLFVTTKYNCDFFVWTTKDWHLERISIDKVFCNEMIVQSRKFFKLCILVEILGKFYK